MFLASVVLLPTLLAQPAKTRDGDWPMYNRDLAGTRYSPLTQINTGNVGKLAKVWSYRFRNDAERAVPRGNIGAFSEVTPIVVNGRMYLTAGDRQGSVALRGEGPAGLQARRAVLGGR
jgi:quinoprotein glucose dehydrogenase